MSFPIFSLPAAAAAGAALTNSNSNNNINKSFPQVAVLLRNNTLRALSSFPFHSASNPGAFCFQRKLMTAGGRRGCCGLAGISHCVCVCVCVQCTKEEMVERHLLERGGRWRHLLPWLANESAYVPST